jgi:hypothetical protein
MDKNSIMEGFTVAYTTHAKKKMEIQNVLPHVDTCNSHSPNFNYFLIASSIGQLNKSKCGLGTEHVYCRVSAIAYGRKSIDYYYSLRCNFESIMRLLETYHNGLPSVQKILASDVISNPKVCAIIEKECLVRPAHLHKSCYLSTHVFALWLAVHRFRFSLEQITECSLPMEYGTEPYKISSTLLYWVKTGCLPLDDLTIALFEGDGCTNEVF